MIEQQSIFRSPIPFAICGLVCFLASLALPAVQLTVLGSPHRFIGGQVTALSIGLGSETIAQVLAAHSVDEMEFILLGVTGFLNVIFLITPAVQIWCRPRPRVLWWLGVVSLLGFILALIAPNMVRNMHPVALMGYFVWLMGYGFILGSVALALVAIRKPALTRR